MIDDSSPPLSREDREELAAAAMSADRRNTPLGFPLLGGAVLGLGVVLLVVSWFSVSGAKREWQSDASKVSKIRRLAAEYDALQSAANDSSNINAHEPEPQMLSRLQGLAAQFGVTVKVPKTPYLSTLDPATRTALFAYDSVENESLANLLGWVHKTTDTIPGMRVDQIKLSLKASSAPSGNDNWRMDVTFARTELVP